MKLNKFLLLIFCFLFSISSVSSQEIKSLYLVQNIPRDNLSNIVDNYLTQSRYNVIYKNDFYFLPSDEAGNSENFYEIILEQAGSNCYLYYSASEDSSYIETKLIQELKKGHCKIKKVESQETKNALAQKALMLKKDADSKLLSEKQYDFSDNAQQYFDEKNNPQNLQQPIAQVQQYSIERVDSNTARKGLPPQVLKQANISTSYQSNKNVDNSPTLKGTVLTIASGTTIHVSLQSSISSGSLSKSDRITAVLDDDFKYNGYLIFPSQTVLYGTAIKAGAATYAYGSGNLELTFNQALLPNGRKVSLYTDKISYVQKSERAINITKNVAAGAGIGVVSGLLSAVCTGNYAQAAIIGAGIGATGGGIYAATRKGQDVEVSEGTILDLKLSQPINISPYKE